MLRLGRRILCACVSVDVCVVGGCAPNREAFILGVLALGHTRLPAAGLAGHYDLACAKGLSLGRETALA